MIRLFWIFTFSLLTLATCFSSSAIASLAVKNGIGLAITPFQVEVDKKQRASLDFVSNPVYWPNPRESVERFSSGGFGAESLAIEYSRINKEYGEFEFLLTQFISEGTKINLNSNIHGKHPTIDNDSGGSSISRNFNTICFLLLLVVSAILFFVGGNLEPKQGPEQRKPGGSEK